MEVSPCTSAYSEYYSDYSNIKGEKMSNKLIIVFLIIAIYGMFAITPSVATCSLTIKVTNQWGTPVPGTTLSIQNGFEMGTTDSNGILKTTKYTNGLNTIEAKHKCSKGKYARGSKRLWIDGNTCKNDIVIKLGDCM